MGFEDNRTDLEKDKFVQTPGGETAIRVLGTWSLETYGTNEIEEVGVVTYFGKENNEGTWLIMKIDETSGTVFSWASLKNNVGVITYSDAWSGRAGLTYGDYSEAV